MSAKCQKQTNQQGTTLMNVKASAPYWVPHFLRFCYAGSATEMREAVERIGKWLIPR
jgi:hypothetical protein